MNLLKLTRSALLAHILLSHFSHADLLDRQLDNLSAVEQALEPQLKLPDLPVTQSIENSNLSTTINTIDQQIEGLQLQKISAKLKQLPAELSIKNKQGDTQFIEVNVENDWRAVKQEWLLMLNEQETDALEQLSQEIAELNIIEKTDFSQLNTSLVRFKVDSSLDSYLALKKILPANLFKKLDRNHIYNTNSQTDPSIAESQAKTLLPVCTAELKVGILDTAIELNHSAFKNSRIKQQVFLPKDIQLPKEHGSAVAALLVSSAKKMPALIPNAQLYSAAVFHAQNTYHQGATLLNLIKGMNWLLSQQVSVINMSLAGPDNQVLAQAVSEVLKQEVTIVAAAGNQGPTAAPLYPAAYSGVLTATAVDKNNQIYRWANQGNYIDFAAPGVSIYSAKIDKTLTGFGLHTGTSMAAPVVSAFTACEKAKNKEYFPQLIAIAKDLGAQGKDAVFGHGLLSAEHIKSAF